MMIIVNRNADSITGAINGKQFGVAFTEQKYAEMKDLEARANAAKTMDELKSIVDEFTPMTVESYKEIVEHAKGGQFLWVNQHTGKIFLAINGKVSSIAIPKALVDRIITSVEKNIDVLPLVKCWARFIREIPGRPKYTAQRGADFAQYIDSDYTDEVYVSSLQDTHGLSAEVARQRGTTKQVAITQEGLLNVYKVSKEVETKFVLDEDENVKTKSRYAKSVDPDTGLVSYDTPDYVEDRLFTPYIMGDRGDAFYSGEKLGHFIRVGQSHFLENWSQVGNPGEKGLHCGGLKYIAGFQQEGTMTHNIFVDPMDIYGIAGLGYGNDGAMTTKRYFVHSSFAGANKGIYHSSEYAKLTDEEYAKLIEAAVEAHIQKVDDLSAELEEQRNLANLSNGNGDAKLTIQS